MKKNRVFKYYGHWGIQMGRVFFFRKTWNEAVAFATLSKTLEPKQ
jgi:hypothetical protein